MIVSKPDIFQVFLEEASEEAILKVGDNECCVFVKCSCLVHQIATVIKIFFDFKIFRVSFHADAILMDCLWILIKSLVVQFKFKSVKLPE